MTGRLYPSLPVLMVDDEESWLFGFETSLNAAGIDNILTCGNGGEALEILAGRNIGVMLLDLIMPSLGGEDILASVTRDYPEIPVIVISGMNELDIAVKCIKMGAYDYLVKTTGEDELVAAVKRAVELRELRNEYAMLKTRFLRDELENPGAFEGIVTKNRQMVKIFQYVEAVAGSDSPVLITGETGVGKELIAKAVHKLSGRRGPFMAVNVAGLDDNVFSDTLFGHLKGAFTDANRRREGFVSKASGGTLFLDEIGDLSRDSQVKLLRLLQENEYFPLGSDIPLGSDARVVAATQMDLAACAKSGRFRKDLYYRLNTHHVHIPPLRDRLDDLPFLTDHFLDEASLKLGKPKPPVPERLLPLLETCRFQGNVRELRSMVFDGMASCKSGRLPLEPFKKEVLKNRTDDFRPVETGAHENGTVFSGFKNLPTLKQVSKELVAEAMIRAKGNRTAAAEILGVTRQALSWRLKNK